MLNIRLKNAGAWIDEISVAQLRSISASLTNLEHCFQSANAVDSIFLC